MSSVTVIPVNETYLAVRADEGISREMFEYFTFEVPGAKWTPQYKHGHWDGKKRLMRLGNGFMYRGLLSHIQKFCEDRNYEFINKIPPNITDTAKERINVFLDTLDLYAHGEKIAIRDYQREAILIALTEQRALLLSPTGSGKSLVIYCISRWLLNQRKKILIICPTVNLVKQFYTDFEDYAFNDSWKPDQNVTKIYGGQEKEISTGICVSTWQSLKDEKSTFFNQFGAIIVDECHLAKGKSLTNILERSTRVPYRIGATGTLDGLKIHRFILEGLLGAVHNIITTKELMDSKTLTSLNIRCILLEYSEAERRRKVDKKFPKYDSEMKFLISHEIRNKFIVNLALNQKGNTLIMFQYVEKHGKILYELLKERVKDRKVFFVHGKIEADIREKIRAITENETNAIIVGSYGAIGLGTNIRALHNIILASPSKSVVRVLQAIGRGLRTVEGKVVCNLFDIGDDLSWKTHQNYTLLHFLDRIKIYAEQEFNYKIFNVDITK